MEGRKEMQLFSIFKELREGFPDLDNNEFGQTSLKEVAEILHCTSRNANLTIKKLIKKNWILWKSGKGRGNYSEICFLLTGEEVVLLEAKEQVKRENLNEAFMLLQKEKVSKTTQQQFIIWLQSQFGFYKNDQGDILKIPIKKTIGLIDPINTACGIETHIVRHIFDGLVGFNSETMEVEPGIAHSWEISENYKVWTFYIRKGVTFHNGLECNAEDIAFTFDRLTSDISLYSWMVRGIEDIKIIDKQTIQFILSEPNRFFLHFISSHAASIVSKQEMLVHSRLVGTGAFKLALSTDLRVSLDANPYHYNGRPFLDMVEIITIKSDENIYENQKRPDQFLLHYLTGQSPSLKNQTKCENGCKIITFNTKKSGPLSNYYFRKLIKQLIDIDEILIQLNNPSYIRADSLCMKENNTDATDRRLDYFTLLNKSGYSGERLHLVTSAYHKEDALVLQQQLKNFNINIDIEITNSTIYGMNQNNPDMILYENLFDDDLVFSLFDTYISSHSYLRQHMNEQMGEKIDQKVPIILNEWKYENQLEHLLKIEKELLEKVSFMCLYRRKYSVEYDNKLEGVFIKPLGWVDFKKLWIKD